ncbi:hypothetical protein CLIB1444_04S00562 [[Candida] jaroonii]|uniref:Uncharacterized protein n=1 Tax=[Candida] jaroonii TaxID=467808 RepID=A0ACA9Y698_9ASCO|nr:hypothetical protein CLIB1444_04S00562 [[Candida] jaroonii]
MADKFGRHKSTRWVRASVPSYGDEWNDEYDYGSGSGSDEEPQVKNSPTDNVVAERFVLPQDKIAEEEQVDTSPQKNEPLVLSIDKLNEDSDNDSDDTVSLKSKPIEDHEGAIKQTILVHKSNEEFQPPSATYSNRSVSINSQPETPMSERSFQSDTDSIQNEPANIRVASLHKKNESFGYNDIIAEYPSEKEDEVAGKPMELDAQERVTSPEIGPEAGELEVDEPEVPEDAELEYDEEADANYESEQEKPDLVLSIDHRNFNESSDSEDDPIPYYEKTAIPHDESFNNSEKDDTDKEEGKDEYLDSFINDLQNSSIHDTVLPAIENDVSLPDFENNYDYYDYVDDDEEDQNVTPIAPLSTVEEKTYHENFVNQLSGHKPSIRKPPTPIGSETASTTSRQTSVRKPPLIVEPPLDSPSYSSFGDAVDAYMSDKSEHKEEPVEEEPPSESDSPQIKHLSQEFQPEDLHPVVSSGSLSTGKHSFDQKGDFSEPPNFEKDLRREELMRRDSTMSTNTFNMGTWKPNTTNFRDQFINDNDNESNFNLVLDNDSNKGYQNFTKMRNVSNASDAMSFMSNASVPETVDIALPSINEDPDDNDETFSSSHDTNESSGLGIGTISTDSILKENDYDNRFHETIESKESLPKQRYSSLLGGHDDDATTTADKSTLYEDTSTGDISSSIAPSVAIHKRVISDTPTMSTQSTKKTFPPQAYPVSNWKTIMKPSQSIDRINLLRDALQKETDYDTGLQTWLSETLKKSDNSSSMHIGKIASQAYQNAAHNDLRRHTSIRSRVSSVRDKVEHGGLHASNLGKKFFNRSKKLMRSS